MPALRQAMTGDPFEDPKRRANKAKIVEVELAVGEFLSQLDQRLFTWMA